MLLALSSLIGNQSHLKVCVCVLMINCIFFLKGFLSRIWRKNQEKKERCIYTLYFAYLQIGP